MKSRRGERGKRKGSVKAVLPGTDPRGDDDEGSIVRDNKNLTES